MANKAPAFQFYVRDWLSDPQLKMASFSTKGIWIDILCYMWEAPERGMLTGTKEQMSRLVGVNGDEFQRFLEEVTELSFCDISVTNNENITESNAKIMLTNRRMYRDEKDRINNKLRQQRFREKHQANHKSNEEITPSRARLSSSSSSSSSSRTSSLPKGNSSKLKKVLPCPHQKIISFYHEILPSLNHIQIWDDTSKKNLKKRWRENPEHQILNFWKTLFEYISESKFLMGEVKDWSADLIWIVKPSNFAKIINGRYHKGDKNLTDTQRFTMSSMEDFINE